MQNPLTTWLNANPTIRKPARKTIFIIGGMYLLLSLPGFIGVVSDYFWFTAGYGISKMMASHYVNTCNDSPDCEGLSMDEFPPWQEYAEKERPVVTWKSLRQPTWYFFLGLFLVLLGRQIDKTGSTASSPAPTVTEKQVHGAWFQAGVFLATSGVLCFIISLYFYNANDGAYMKEDWRLVKGLMFVSVLMSCVGALLLFGRKVPRLVGWIIIPILIWTLLGGPMPYAVVKPLAPSEEVPVFDH